ncbi:MAG: methyl-accepting chemotaxis protein, partial [Pseudomonadota bacterium]
MNTLTVAKRIYLGFLGVLAIAGVAIVIQLAGLYNADKEFLRFEDMATDALLASELNADMAKLQLNMREYIATRSAGDLAAARDFEGQLRDGIAIAEDEINKPERAERIDTISGSIDLYASGIERLVGLYERRDQLVAELDEIGPQIRTSLTEINTGATRDNDLETANLVGQVQANLLLARLYTSRFLITNAQSDADRATSELANVTSQLGALDRSIQSPLRRQLLAQITPQVPVFAERLDELVGLISERNNIRSNVLDSIGNEIGTLAAEVKSSATVDANTLSAETQEGIANSFYLALVAATAAIVLGLGLAFTIARSIVSPMSALTEAMTKLAGGDLTSEIPARDRSDELGSMASAVEVFKEQGLEKVRLEDEQEQTRIKAEADKRDAMAKLAQGFEESVGGVIKAVTSESSDLRNRAEAMAGAADTGSQTSSVVASAAVEASASVDTVAAAAEEISASINEIARQVDDSTAITSKAVARASDAGNRVQGLSEAASNIGEVVKIIAEIAEQTNLLALNATIEAARAGE